MKNERFPFLSWVVCGLFISGAVQANQLLVPADYPTVQAAINAANAGDTVLVSPGTYYENLDFKGKAITVASADGPQTTIIDGSHAGAVVNFSSVEGPDSVIRGFTIQDGYSSWGSGISLFVASPTIVSNIIQYNDEVIGYWGAGIGGWSSSPIIEQNLFRYNTGDSQYLTGVIAFVNGSSPLVANNIFESNSCRAITLILPADTAPVVINNTIVGNPVGIDASIFGEGIFENNILLDNDTGAAVGGNIVWANNLVFGGQTLYAGQDLTGTNGNISADPLFVDPADADFHLQAGSPAIDAGDNAALFLPPPVDFDGNPRIIAGHTNGPAVVDIGAFEFNPANAVVSPPVITCPEPMTVECGLGVVPMVQVFSPAGEAMTIVWSVDGMTVQTNLVVASNPPVTAGVTASLGALPPGTNLVEVTVTDSSSNTASCSTTITVVDTMPPVIDSASASPNILWPPNHNLVTVAFNAAVTDNCGPATWKIIKVQSNEPVNGPGDGNTAPDWQILGDHAVSLRAERSGAGSGRIYLITLQAEDVAGNLSMPSTVTVTVPRNMGK
ncbi:MAG TPA: choice-of-anchor Q domain-containing protein [Verrucomicrobiae bacterium]|nr:choice-of-anchor Q domain-containing protein [Verrucomicrobiae bacterium]